MKNNKFKISYILPAVIAIFIAIAIFITQNILTKKADSSDSDELSASVNSSDEAFSSSENDSSAIPYIVFSETAGFYDDDITLSLSVLNPDGSECEDAVIYYSLDGTVPDSESRLYTSPILLGGDIDFDPNTYTVRAVATLSGGTKTEVATSTYFVNRDIETRFSTLVFCISGDPAELTEGPDGTFYGSNIKVHGESSEREVYVEVFTSSGERIIAQNAGIRPYGGASRDSFIHSIKLYARGSYDTKDTFDLDVFGTTGYDGNTISSYKRLVLRNFGNDYQFGFIRDEYIQTLAAQAGFPDCEGVVPAVALINGEYAGFYYLHENYCDSFLKSKYGTGDTEGEFDVIKGGDTYKENTDKNSDEYDPIADEYVEKYLALSSLDLTKDENFEKVNEFMDVENYLFYYAINVYMNNWDWPNNNNACYRYVADDGESYGEGVFDGRWRFILHDVDYTANLYDDEKTCYDYDSLTVLMDPDDNRYSPMFTALMKREDMQEYFCDKIYELINGSFEYENASEVLSEMVNARQPELEYYFSYCKVWSKQGAYKKLWSSLDYVDYNIRDIDLYMKKRPQYITAQLIKHFQ